MCVLFLCCALQLDMDDFQGDDDQLQKWATKKWDEADDGEHEAKINTDNWRLTERWFCFQEGRSKTNSSTMQEGLSRSGDSLQSGLAMMNIDEAPKICNKKTPAEKHKQMMGRVVLVLNKLGRAIVSCETQMPSLKRSIDGESYHRVRLGLMACRECKEQSLDKLEDFKKNVPPEEEIDDMIIDMAKLQKSISESLDALTECMGNHKMKPSIKGEQPAPGTEADGAEAEGLLGEWCVGSEKILLQHLLKTIFPESCLP